MAPKKKAKVLDEPPAVPQAILEQAKKTLADAEVKRRGNSNMHYWLETTGQKKAYESISAAEKKDFFLKWYAWQSTTAKVTSRGTRSTSQLDVTNDRGRWVAKQQMINELGEVKALAKIAALDQQPSRHRPDRDTGGDGEWEREYKLFDDTTDNRNVDSRTRDLIQDQDLASEQEKREALEDIASVAGAGSASSGLNPPAVCIKTEKGATPETKTEMAPETKTSANDQKTFESLKNTPRKVLLQIGNASTELKVMSGKIDKLDKSVLKYVGTLKEDIDKLIPKMKAHFQKVEKIVAENAYEKDEEKLGMAIKLNQDFASYNEYSEWLGRLLPKDKKK